MWVFGDWYNTDTAGRLYSKGQLKHNAIGIIIVCQESDISFKRPDLKHTFSRQRLYI